MGIQDALSCRVSVKRRAYAARLGGAEALRHHQCDSDCKFIAQLYHRVLQSVKHKPSVREHIKRSRS